jgi:hypothetical protein
MLSLDEIIFDEEPHTYTFRGRRYDSVTQVIQLAGLGYDWSVVPQDRLEYAQRRGRLVHMACHYIDDGDLKLESVAEEIRGYVEAYFLFRAECAIKPIAVEKKMVSEAMGLAGTPDLVCFLRGQRVVIDRKTSQIMSKSMGLQTAGYKALWNALFPNTPIRERYGLRLEKTGKYKLFPHDDYEDDLAFFEAISHARSIKRMEGWIKKYGHISRPGQLRPETSAGVGHEVGLGAV